MDHLENLSTEELEKKIKERESWFKEVIDFVEGITGERGKVIKRVVNNSNTHIERELKDFGDFNFFYSTGESAMGGNTVLVSQSRNSGPLVLLYLWWQSDDDTPEVNTFLDKPEWQKELKDVMARKQEIIKTMDRKSVELEETRAKNIAEVKRRKELLEKAKRLKLG